MGWFSSSLAPAKPEEIALAEAEALQGFRGLLEGRGIDAGELSHKDLLRFLRARKLDLPKAADFLSSDMAWRRDNRIKERSLEDGASVLGCAPAKLQAVLPHACPGGLDKQGRPLLFKHFGGQCELRKVLRETCESKLHDYNWWLNEQHVRRLDEVGADKWVVIMDAKGWYPALFDTTAFRFLKAMAKIDSDHYPERLGAIVVINAPATLAFCWKVVRTWLDEETRQKVDIISTGNPIRAKDRILALADPAQLPQQYCGTAPPLATWPEWPSRSGLPVLTP